jgi:dTDP-4-dehydrorhamnose reductase
VSDVDRRSELARTAGRKVYITGGGGFVGSNLVHELAEHGDEMGAPARAEVDITDPVAVSRSVADFAPDAIVHCAILNDLTALASRRQEAWRAYVGATRNVVDAANQAGAHVVLVSTDWVFDGTQGPATEEEPPNPVNAYGFLKAASELVVAERADRGAVARISGVQGVHRTRPQAPRSQDHGFGYFVAALVDALRDGEPFTVWEGDDINMVATPTLATDAARLIRRILERGSTGIHHCCGGEHATRAELARAAVAAFELDAELLGFGPPDPPGAPVPYDTRLDATATAARLGVELPGVATQLERLREEMTCLTT